MKKRLFFSILLGLLIPISVLCQPSVVEFPGSFVGNVKSCKSVIKFPISEGRHLPSGEERVIYFNISRSGMEEETIYPDGSKTSQTIVQKTGKKQINSVHKDASGRTVRYYTETWDSLDGKIVKETRTRTSVNSVENKEKTGFLTYEYDTVENKTYITSYQEGIPISQTVETRDYSGLLIKDVWYHWGWFYQKSEERGLLKGSRSNISISTSYIYNAKGKLIQTIEYHYGIEGVTSRSVSYYDKNGRETRKCVYDPDDYINSEIKISYDSKGMVTQKAFKYFNDGETTTLVEKYVIKYDKQGNWIFRQAFVNGELYYTDTREIEYWD